MTSNNFPTAHSGEHVAPLNPCKMNISHLEVPIGNTSCLSTCRLAGCNEEQTLSDQSTTQSPLRQVPGVLRPPLMGDIAKRKAWHQDPKLELCTALPELATVLNLVRHRTDLTPGLVSRLYHTEREVQFGTHHLWSPLLVQFKEMCATTDIQTRNRRWKTQAQQSSKSERSGMSRRRCDWSRAPRDSFHARAQHDSQTQ